MAKVAQFIRIKLFHNIVFKAKRNDKYHFLNYNCKEESSTFVFSTLS